MTDPVITCPACGSQASGKFCAQCGRPTSGPACSACGSPMETDARFCSRCSAPAGTVAAGPGRDRTPWIIAGVSLAALLAVLLLMVSRQSPALPVQSEQSETGTLNASSSGG